MLWSTVAPVVLSTVTSIALEPGDLSAVGGASAFSAVWVASKRPFVAPNAAVEILLSIPTSKNTTTENRNRFEAGENFQDIHGMRDFTLRVQVRSYRQDVPHWALEICERIMTRLERDSVSDALRAVNACVVEALAVVDVPNVKLDDRIGSVATLDVQMRAGFSDVQASGYIGALVLSTHVSNPNGDEYPSPPNLVDETIMNA